MEYSDFLQLVLSRQSDRAYDKERPVETEKLERILEAGRLQCPTLEGCGDNRP